MIVKMQKTLKTLQETTFFWLLFSHTLSFFFRFSFSMFPYAPSPLRHSPIQSSKTSPDSLKPL